MPASILDLVSYWSPHPAYPGVWQFKTKYNLMGFAFEDGTLLHVMELHPQGPERARLLLCLKFFQEARSSYDLILVELVRKADLLKAMIDTGFCACHVRTSNPGSERWTRLIKARSGSWVTGMAWSRSNPDGMLKMNKSDSRNWDKGWPDKRKLK